MRPIRYLSLILLMMTLILGCTNKAVRPAKMAIPDIAYPFTWIDAPLDESWIPLAPYEIVFHISDPSGMQQGELSINGVVLASIPVADTGSKLVTLKQAWSPDQPGEYLIQARAQNSAGDWGTQAEAKVFIGEKVITLTPSPEITPSLSITTTMTPSATFTATPTSTSTATSYPDEMVFYPSVTEHNLKVGSCQPNQAEIQVSIIPFDKIQYVYLFFHLKDQESTETTSWNDGIPMLSAGSPGIYSYTLRTASITDNKKFDSAFLWYQFVVTDKDKKNIGRSDVLGDVTISTCGSMPVIGITAGGISPGISIKSPTPTQQPIIVK